MEKSNITGCAITMTWYLILSQNDDGSIKEKRPITDINARILQKARMGRMLISDDKIIAIEKEDIERAKKEGELFAW